MSETSDRERAEIRNEERNVRLEKFLLELLTVVRSRARNQPSAVIAGIIERSERTVRNRYQTLDGLDDVLLELERKGIKKSQY